MIVTEFISSWNKFKEQGMEGNKCECESQASKRKAEDGKEHQRTDPLNQDPFVDVQDTWEEETEENEEGYRSDQPIGTVLIVA